MGTRAARVPRRYETSLDRAGFALLVGGMLGGAGGLGLVALGGSQDPMRLAMAFALGTLCSALAITAVAGPLWLFFHVIGLRRPSHAASLGAGLALAIFVGGQTYGFGFSDPPPMDHRAILFRWASAGATSVLIAAAAALIALVMWRIAYRRARPDEYELY